MPFVPTPGWAVQGWVGEDDAGIWDVAAALVADAACDQTGYVHTMAEPIG